MASSDEKGASAFVRVFVRLCEVVVVAAVALITVIVLIGVYYRYVLGDALSWSDEAARYLMIWLGFTAAGLMLHEDGHIGLTVFRDMCPLRVRVAAILLSDVLVLTYLVFLCKFSWSAMQIVENDIAPGLHIRMIWPFLALPTSAAMMSVHVLSVVPRHVRLLRGTDEGGEAAPEPPP